MSRNKLNLQKNFFASSSMRCSGGRQKQVWFQYLHLAVAGIKIACVGLFGCTLIALGCTRNPNKKGSGLKPMILRICSTG